MSIDENDWTFCLHCRELEGKLGELRQQYRSKLEQVRSKNEEQTQSSVSELEGMYQSQIADLRRSQEEIELEHRSQLETFRKQVGESSSMCVVLSGCIQSWKTWKSYGI